MSMLSHTVTLKSDRHFGSRIPPSAFGEILPSFQVRFGSQFAWRS